MTTTDPTAVALYGHRFSLWLRNATLSSGSITDLYVSRVQSVEPTATSNTTKQYELGNVSPVGSISDPSQMRIVIEQNLYNSQADMFLAGVNPTSGSGFNIANMLTQINTGYLVVRDNTDVIVGEIGVGNLRVTELQYRFVNNGPCTIQYTLEGTSGSFYTSNFPHPVWGTSDTTAYGGIHGKDAVISIGSPGLANKAYRLQSFTARVAYPSESPTELGRRQRLGTLIDTPDVTLDFDLLATESAQPYDVFYGTSNDGGATKYNLADPQTQDIFINVYDPTLAEWSSVVKSFRIDNCKPTSTARPARVRQLATERWSLMSQSSDTVGTGGMTISKTAINS